MDNSRYSVFFVPREQTDLARFGNAILQRRADASVFSDPGIVFSDTLRWAELIATPAHYGFHATLKAPFSLAESTTVADLFEAVTQLSSTLKPCPMHTLKPALLGKFMALQLQDQEEHAQVAELTNECVQALEHLRAPLSEEDGS